jgi:hypothetical protein
VDDAMECRGCAGEELIHATQMESYGITGEAGRRIWEGGSWLICKSATECQPGRV